MRRTICLLACVLLVAPALASDTSERYDGPAESDGIEGTWEIAWAEYDGLKTPRSGREESFRGGKYTWKDRTDCVQGVYRIDTSRIPHHLDVTPAKGTPFVASKNIYRVEGDTLTVGWNPEDLDKRPADFHDAKYIATFRRVKR
jgi:uncharacterized protein (TIGR03067 family)